MSRCHWWGARTWLMSGKPAKAMEETQADECALLCFVDD